MAYVVAQEYIRARDSDGVTHYIDRQNEPESCALASIGMMWDQSRQQCSVGGEGGYKAISANFSGSLLPALALFGLLCVVTRGAERRSW